MSAVADIPIAEGPDTSTAEATTSGNDDGQRSRGGAQRTTTDKAKIATSKRSKGRRRPRARETGALIGRDRRAAEERGQRRVLGMQCEDAMPFLDINRARRATGDRARRATD